jgi:spore coat protein CotH
MSAQVSARCRLVASVAALASVALVVVDAQTTSTLPSDSLFNSNTVQRIDLRMHSADWAKLKENFQTNEYYPADVVFNGQTVRNTGIRSRGLGSRNQRKPGLRVDFDRYTSEQKFLGLKSFILDNLVQDPSTVKETVVMKFFARLGIPAPREAHVRLYVNNAYAGLYAVVESIDKTFLARTFGIVEQDTQNDGYLFEFNYVDAWYFSDLGTNIESWKLRFDAKTRENKSDAEKYGPIADTVRMANELPIEQFMTTLNEHLNLRAFMRYAAAQNFVAQEDGFLGYAGMNNFYLYRLEGSSQHVFIAWDEDNAFHSADFSVTRRHDENVLMRKAMQIPELRTEYYDMLARAAASASEATGSNNLGWMEYEMRRQLDLIAQPIRDDEFKPYSISDHEAARAQMLTFAQTRARIVTDQIRNR